VSQARGEPAGFGRRYAAWSLDWLLLGAVLAFALVPLLQRAWSQLQALEQELQDAMYERLMSAGSALASPLALATKLLDDPAIAATIRTGSAQISLSLLQAALIAFGASALYFAASEGSAWQATPGKRLLGLRVRDMRGERVGFGRALIRHLTGAISWLTFNLGHAIAGWRRDRRALHDLLAGTQVLAITPMPAWARAWLGVQAALLLGVLLGGFGWLGWLLYQLATL
jgi:uncharacterized RDD family membrane protein YckC